MSQHSDAQPQPSPLPLQDPQYTLDPTLLQKQQHQILSSNFSHLLSSNLSKFNRIFDGTSCAFTKLSLINKRLFTLLPQLSSYQHLREISLKHNFLTEFDNLLYLKYLVSLDLSNNKIEDIRALDNTEILPFLKELDLSENKIKRLVNLPLPRLKVVRLRGNEIEQIEFEGGNETIEEMDLRGNRIRDVGRLSGFLKLQELDLSENQIDDISVLSELPKLRRLVVVKNRIERVGEPMKGVQNLVEIDLRENKISKLESLQGVSDNVSTLNITDNPLTEELGENTRKQIWMLYRFYRRINDADIEPDEKMDWDKEYKDRKEEERMKLQQERLEQEQKEREEREREAAEREAKEAEEKQRLEEERERLEEERRVREEEERNRSEEERERDKKGGKEEEGEDDEEDS